ncbi:hypothetical protein BD310DRAFT_930347 [Dichomitus squalens]|uniref:Uncharacterized protein n=1 Tax=Dichomitus squalens TaxID=114155 RepID=A0A4Q9PRJ8_9APHY|nr:hypothetical protein BD310DRAFT_930347 [Dichomitus squalens]
MCLLVERDSHSYGKNCFIPPPSQELPPQQNRTTPMSCHNASSSPARIQPLSYPPNDPDHSCTVANIPLHTTPP